MWALRPPQSQINPLRLTHSYPQCSCFLRQNCRMRLDGGIENVALWASPIAASVCELSPCRTGHGNRIQHAHSGRRTRVNGSLGAIVGTMGKGITFCDIRTGKTTHYTNEIPEHLKSGHGGGDFGLVYDFVRAVESQDPTMLTSSIEESVESHLMGYRAEESRHSGKTMKVNMESYQ